VNRIKIMNDLSVKMYQLIKEFGIESVMNELKVKHSNKVFIPNWFNRGHLESFGFKFDEESFDMDSFSDFMNGYGINDEISEFISSDYPELWEEYKKNY